MATFPSIQASYNEPSPDPFDGGPSFIVAPVPRRHLTLQRSESQHWLGSPPLSPVSAVSRTLSPLSHTSTSPTFSRRRYSSSFAALVDSGARHTPSFGGSRSRTQSDPVREDTGLVRRWTRWMSKQGLRRHVMPLIIVSSTLIKWSVGLGSYSGMCCGTYTRRVLDAVRSGKGTPPMFGDYEAQRHWMELTIHLPTNLWYTYDLQYWGLDYPPLTAYVSWVCGFM